MEKNHILIYTGDGMIEILELQVEGKKRMNVQDFLRGFVFSSEDLFL
jgi:methionyl-tRNA formyltransferase